MNKAKNNESEQPTKKFFANQPEVIKLDKNFSMEKVHFVKDSSKHSSKIDITKTSFFKNLSRLKNQQINNQDKRYSVLKRLDKGEGGKGIILSVQDYDLDRKVAIKFLKNVLSEDENEIRSFVEEARNAANLEHPNIIPIYDLNIDNEGKIYICMKNIQGQSLGEWIREASEKGGSSLLAFGEVLACGAVSHGGSQGGIKTIEDIILIFLKVCDALSFAHSKGVIHQDIKPDNIMIGEFGEVFLIDWGASSYTDEEMSVTPAYMSPEQARSENPTVYSDIYCLGATFFHTLTLRRPTLAETMEELWEKRIHGIIDMPTREEQAAIPQPLLAIALKAMNADHKKRYSSVKDFEKDLKDYQAGLAVSAYKDTLWGYLKRWYRRNSHTFWSAVIILTVLMASGLFFYNLKLKEVAYWGKPVVFEDFEDNSWEKDWEVVKGEWEVKNGRIVTKRGDPFFLFHKKKYYGGTALEFEGEVMPNSTFGEISIVWCAGDDINNQDNYYLIQTNAYGSFAGIMKRNLDPGKGGFASDALLAYNDDFKLKKRIVYKVRAEIDGAKIALYVDGRKLCEYKDIFPLTEGYIGLYGFFPGKIFDNVKIYSKGVAEKIRIIDTGDSYFRKKLYKLAVEEYEKVISSHRNTKIGQEALYKQGLCYYRDGEEEKAYSIWRRLKGTWLENNTRIHFLEREFKKGNHDFVFSEMENLYTSVDKPFRQQIVALWNLFVSNMLQEKPLPYKALREYVLLSEKLFTDTKSYHFNAAEVLLHLDEPKEVLKKYSDNKDTCTRALHHSGRFEDMLKCSTSELARGFALIALGRSKEVLKKYPDITSPCAEALLCLKRYEEVLEKYSELDSPDIQRRCALALIYLNRPEEALEKYPDLYPQCLMARSFIALKSYITDKKKNAGEVFAFLQNVPLDIENKLMSGFSMLFIPPFLEFIEGDKTALEKKYEKIIDVYRYKYYKTLSPLSYVLGKGTDEEYLSQPVKLYLEARFFLFKAMRFEYSGNVEAVDYYRQYKKLPSYKKMLNPLIDLFVDWRIQELSRDGGAEKQAEH